MILVDTSAWVEYDRATGSPVDQRLAELVATQGPYAATDVVLMEVLAGARSDERADGLRRLLISGGWVPMDLAADFEGAAHCYRSCRAAGVTPRGLADCLVAVVAQRSGAELLAADRDFRAIAPVVPLRLDPACPE